MNARACYGLTMNYTSVGLGRAIRARREQIEGLSQRALGEAAQYAGGSNAAAVAMSRVENGQMKPGHDKLAAIAKALDVDLETLLAEAKAADPPAPTASAPALRTATSKARLEAVEREQLRRSRLIEDLGSRFRTAHDDARDRFLLKFLDIAESLSDSPETAAPEVLDGDGLLDLNKQAVYLATLSAGVAVRHESVSTDVRKNLAADEVALFSALLAGPLNGAAIQVARGLLGTRRGRAATMAAGTYVALPVVGIPAAAVLAAVMSQREITRRSKQRESELAAKVATAESVLAESGPGFDVLVESLTRATAVLEYIALHASHAFDRWSASLPSPSAAESLSEKDKKRYEEFREIAGCQMNIVRIDFGALVTVPPSELAPLADLTTDTLDFAQATVEALV